MTDRTTEALLARRALAEKATPGPWKPTIYFDASPYVEAPGDKNVLGNSIAWLCPRDPEMSCQRPRDAAHIAANSPDVVMADINEILRLRAEVERLEREADWLANELEDMDHCPYLANWEPDWCTCLDTPEDGFECNEDFKECWRKAAREALEGNND